MKVGIISGAKMHAIVQDEDPEAARYEAQTDGGRGKAVVSS